MSENREPDPSAGAVPGDPNPYSDLPVGAYAPLVVDPQAGTDHEALTKGSAPLGSGPGQEAPSEDELDARLRARRMTEKERMIQVRSGAPFSEILRFFAYSHLPPHLAGASEPFAELALRINDSLPPSPERTAGLRKLLEAKDCIVRCVVVAKEKALLDAAIDQERRRLERDRIAADPEARAQADRERQLAASGKR